jgi:hypothetical protein
MVHKYGNMVPDVSPIMPNQFQIAQNWLNWVLRGQDKLEGR